MAAQPPDERNVERSLERAAIVDGELVIPAIVREDLAREPTPHVPKVEIDAFEARQALLNMVDNADDGDVIAFYKVVYRTNTERQQIKSTLNTIRGRIEEMRDRPPEEY